MGARVVRIVFLLAAVAAALAIAPAASAAVARDEGAEAPAADACAGPCPTHIAFKGPGSGRLASTPAGYECESSWRTCSIEPNNETVGGTLILHPELAQGSYLQGWELCPRYTGARGEDCAIDLNVVGGRFTLCVIFNLEGQPPVPKTDCPPPVVYPPAPPAPPPSGPPPLGSRCTIPGTAGADVINGTVGRDVICGRGGNDTINGRGGHDLVLGGAGADRITGGGGRDALYGGGGNDTLLARDGVRDTLNGGLGRDRARWDAVDVRRSIERRA